MYRMKNIRWIDLIRSRTLMPSQQESAMMKGQGGFVQVETRECGDVSCQSRWRALCQRIARWHQLGQQRRTLAALSDGALKDLGLSRADIHYESERPFWDDPLKK
jgi:uncharacterized protein YjiS (DUF1127 family)